MLSKNKIKYIRSLEQKKYRKEEKAFLAEGHKLVGDLSGHFECRLVAATSTWLESHPDIKADEIVEVSEEELKKASLLKTPQDVLAVFRIPETDPGTRDIAGSLCLALDDVQDPGNLGTILRTADWFGIRHVFCSIRTADAYNPKTVQATMGALARVRIHYCDLKDLIGTLPDMPVYGTFLDGKNIYGQELTPHGLIVMGNEGKGISQEMEKLVNRRLLIPNYPQGEETSESLNVATATAIVCAEFRRRML
ncbi:MAG TPA: RNA methyltransferase [Candidatus Phocaeicola excrementigallinarum]|nr:RNA methyltransferase [Candidatus Phocaeicola excrementigallinarum]